MDTRLLKATFEALAPQAPEIVEEFYGRLAGLMGFEAYEDMFPVLMGPQRDKLLKALIYIVTHVEDLDALAPYLAELGKGHRRFGLEPRHFDMVGRALLATLASRAGAAWTREVAEAWAEAVSLVAQVMLKGLTAKDGEPWWWDAVVVDKEMRSYDIAVIRLRLAAEMTWKPGQSVYVRLAPGDGIERWAAPPVWRPYSPANVPNALRTMELHVKIVPGGLLSMALAMHAEPGTRLRLGPPAGSLMLDESSRRPVVMVAGSTGLAPMMAMLERIRDWDSPPPVQLFFGAADPDRLYDLEKLAKLEREHGWLTVASVVQAPEDVTPGFEGRHGSVVDIAVADGPWPGHDAYICGPPQMVAQAAGRLVALGTPGGQIHVESFGWEGHIG